MGTGTVRTGGISVQQVNYWFADRRRRIELTKLMRRQKSLEDRERELQQELNTWKQEANKWMQRIEMLSQEAKELMQIRAAQLLMAGAPSQSQSQLPPMPSSLLVSVAATQAHHSGPAGHMDSAFSGAQ